MSQQTVDTVIFDVGKVLVDYDWQGYLASFGFDENTYKSVANAVFCHPLWDEHDRGLCSDEEYLRQFIANAPEYEREIRHVLEHEGNCIHLFDYAEDWVRQLKNQGLHLYILSNYSRSLFEKTKEKMAFLPYMDGIVFSYEVHQRKPYHCIYQTLLQKFRLEPSRCVFIDDRQENLQSAADLGIHTILFTQYEKTCRQLQQITV